MPRYFFNRSDGYFERDLDGTELKDVHAARIEAVTFAGASLKEDPSKVWAGQDFRVEVTDANGLILFTVIVLAINSPSTSLGSKPNQPLELTWGS
jgi:hypothetical protein